MPHQSTPRVRAISYRGGFYEILCSYAPDYPIAALLAAVTLCWAAPTAQIFTEIPSPQPVGTLIGITAIGKDEGEPEKYAGLLRYRFSADDEGGTFSHRSRLQP